MFLSFSVQTTSRADLLAADDLIAVRGIQLMSGDIGKKLVFKEE